MASRPQVAAEKPSKKPQVAAEKPYKKRYQKPVLKMYGNFNNLTHALGMGTFNDGMAGKTH